MNDLKACILCFCPFSGVEAQIVGGRRRWVCPVNPTPPIHQPGDYFQHPLQNVRASLSRRWVHHLLSKMFPRVSIKIHKHIMCHYFLLTFIPVNGGPWQWVHAVEWVVSFDVCRTEALFENHRMWQDPLSVTDITLYGLWWEMCQRSVV